MATAYNPKAVSEALIRKIGSLPAARIAEVEEFVDFIGQREVEGTGYVALRTAAMAASAPSFAAIWNNPEDDVYDAL
jgi:hypothetical protein